MKGRKSSIQRSHHESPAVPGTQPETGPTGWVNLKWCRERKPLPMPGDSTCTLHTRRMDKWTIEWVGMKGARAICMPAIRFSIDVSETLTLSFSHFMFVLTPFNSVPDCWLLLMWNEKQSIHQSEYSRLKTTKEYGDSRTRGPWSKNKHSLQRRTEWEHSPLPTLHLTKLFHFWVQVALAVCFSSLSYTCIQYLAGSEHLHFLWILPDCYILILLSPGTSNTVPLVTIHALCHQLKSLYEVICLWI